ncbi:hypothetical protein [Streptomyces xantholiticus]|uniref:hypothetical protein n=1 Tax=Streptomyces xantholiticus TaxID=68285 RepID=UPI0027E3B6CA|nr:hypothetical protein [Streptomyces xantholiticus]
MAANTHPVDLHGIGTTWFDLLSRAMQRGLAARAAIPREAMVDAPYSWLSTDRATNAPSSTMQSAPAGPTPKPPGSPVRSPAPRAAARTPTTWSATA